MDDITKNLSQAYLQVLGLGKEEAVADKHVIAEEELDEAKMDPVNKKALKKDFKDHKDKDIDNDGDEDESDEYLHNRRKAIAKAVKEETSLEEFTDEELDDFMVSEEFEQLDEISLDKMKAAHKELKGRAYDAHMDDNKYMARKYASRALHVSDKIKKKERDMKKENFDQFTDEEIIEFMLSDEFEQLDEISQGLLRRYHGAAASDLQKRRKKLARGTMTTQDHKAGQRRVAGLNRAANKMEATENEMKYGRNAGILIDRVQEAKDPKAGATAPQTYGDNASQNTKDFVDMHKAEVSHDAEKANMQNFKNFTAKVKVAKKRPNDNSAGDTKVVK